MTRVFKTRHFQRRMRKTELTEAVLCKAVQEMAAGLIDADLGGGVLKKRVGLAGRGKRGGVAGVVPMVDPTSLDQQEVDRGEGGAGRAVGVARDPLSRLEHLPIPPALGMRLEGEGIDQLPGALDHGLNIGGSGGTSCT